MPELSDMTMQELHERQRELLEELKQIEIEAFKKQYSFQPGDKVNYTARYQDRKWRAVGTFIEYYYTDKPCLVIEYKEQRRVFVYSQDRPVKSTDEVVVRENKHE